MKKFIKAINIISMIIFIPTVVLSLLCSVLMLNAKKHNECPSLFGYSAVVIVTDSMENGDNFNVGDFVLVKKVLIKSLEVGDIIAYYEPIPVNQVREVDLQEASDDAVIDNEQPATLWKLLGQGVYTEEQKVAAQQGSKVIFHRIQKIKKGYDNNGNLHYYFQTMGDNNNNIADKFLVMDDYVVGSFYEKGDSVASIFKFCASTLGICLIVLVPSALLIGMLITSIVDQKRNANIHYEENSELSENIKSAFGQRNNAGIPPTPPPRPGLPPRPPKQGDEVATSKSVKKSNKPQKVAKVKATKQSKLNSTQNQQPSGIAKTPVAPKVPPRGPVAPPPKAPPPKAPPKVPPKAPPKAPPPKAPK